MKCDGAFIPTLCTYEHHRNFVLQRPLLQCPHLSCEFVHRYPVLHFQSIRRSVECGWIWNGLIDCRCCVYRRGDNEVGRLNYLGLYVHALGQRELIAWRARSCWHQLISAWVFFVCHSTNATPFSIVGSRSPAHICLPGTLRVERRSSAPFHFCHSSLGGRSWTQLVALAPPLNWFIER